jgi:ABC-type uncharacterized transport system permease subunit
MSAFALTLGATVVYLLATTRLALLLFRPRPGDDSGKAQALAFGFVALLLHGAALYQEVFVPTGLNLAFFNALSLFAWLIVALTLAASLTAPLENLALVAMPLSALAALASGLFPGERLVALNRGFGFELHLVLAITAYSVAGVAAVQALVLAYQERQLRSRRIGSSLRALPPLQTMETLLFQLIGAAFFLLSLAIVSGVMFVQDLLAQHVAHKTVLSLIAWAIFGVLLWGRRQYGWRGRLAVRWSLGGFAALLLAYFGSKFVLELILKR